MLSIGSNCRTLSHTAGVLFWDDHPRSFWIELDAATWIQASLGQIIFRFYRYDFLGWIEFFFKFDTNIFRKSKMPHLHSTVSFYFSFHFDHLLPHRQPSSEELHCWHRICFPFHLTEVVNSSLWLSQRCSRLPPWVHISKKKDLKLFICKPLLNISPPWTHPADPPGFPY